MTDGSTKRPLLELPLSVLLTCRLRSGAFKAVSAEGKYGRTTERAYNDIRAYGKKESTMLIFYEVCLELPHFGTLVD